MAIDKVVRAGVSAPASPSEAARGVGPAARRRALQAAAQPAMQTGRPIDANDSTIAAQRLALGRTALTAKRTHGVMAPPQYFKSYEQTKAWLAGLKEKYPHLVDVIDIGDSHEKVSGKADRDILVLRLTNKANTQPKPGVLFFGGQHAREIANPELLTRYAEWLLANYGKDPEATATLDNRVVDLIPLMNPDGRAVIERGYAGEPGGSLDWRKNTNGEGVDLNRNWATSNWGGPGADHYTGSEIYCGPSPASEPEVQAMQSFIAASRPSIVIDWHSFSELNLYPPEDDASKKTPDDEHFARVGKKMSALNGYTSQPAVALYPTSGTSMWAYEKFGIPTFTIETGVAFLQSDLTVDVTWKENFPLMKYMVAIADDWRQRSAGPEVRRAKIAADGSLTLRASDKLTHASATKAEVVFDPSTPAGQGIAASATEGGVFTATLEQNAARKLVYLRACDADGNWGPLKAQWLEARSNRAVAVRAREAAVRRAS